MAEKSIQLQPNKILKNNYFNNAISFTQKHDFETISFKKKIEQAQALK